MPGSVVHRWVEAASVSHEAGEREWGSVLILSAKTSDLIPVACDSRSRF